MQTTQNEAIASYTAVGTRQIVEQTFWQIPFISRGIDPLAQTFLLSTDRFVTSVGLFFASKDPDLDVTIQIRNVVNGYPGTTVLTTKTLRPSEITISNDGSVETKVTFPDPVLISSDVEYAIAILTESSQYRVYVAKMNQKDLASNQIVAQQPYTVGVMFSSSNATTWTPHHDIDLKFKIYAAKFKDTSTINFDPISMPNVAGLLLGVNQIVPRDSSIIWQWSEDGNQWYALADSDLTQTGEELDNVLIRAVLNSSGGKASPVIQTSNIVLIGTVPKTQGTYISRNIVSEPFTTITVYIDMSVPSGTSQTVEYSFDGTNWISFDAAIDSQQVDKEFIQYKYEATVDTAETNVRIRIIQNTMSALVEPKARRLMVLLS